MAFSHVQGGGIDKSSSVSTATITLTSNPVQGNVVVVGVALDAGSSGFTGITVKDSNNNSYTKTPSSPLNLGATNAQAALFYLIAPSNATKTITISWTGATTTGDFWADEFSGGGSNIIFDKDNHTSSVFGTTTINLPALVTTGTNELLYAIAFPGGSISAPAAGATLGIWTGSSFGPSATTGGDTEYLLSGSGSVTPQFTDSASGDTVAVIIAAFFVQAFEDDSFVQFQPPPFDPIVSVW